MRNLISLKDHSTHVSRLHPYLYDEMRHDPRDAALRDENEFEVEAILNHSGTPKKRVDMKFLVKWRGYEEPSSNTWEPWANVRLVGKLHEYLRNNNMKGLVPKNLHD